jgi:ubiquitin carboxyl-terminal hydrolase 25
MFVPGDEIVDVDGDGIQKKTVNLTCIVDDCQCNIEVSMLPPVITDEYVQKFRDVLRVKQNLRVARQEFPDRYPRPDESYAQDVIPTFLQYLRDTLDASPEKPPPGKIKTRNKMFIACFGDDFDGFLRSLHFEKLVLEDDDVWTFPKLEPLEVPTPLGTLRARWEDVEAELLLLARRFVELKAAWNDLQHIFSGTYKALNRNMLPHIQDDALQLLGCLEDYRPTTFSWAAMLLGDKCSERRSDFIAAAQRCGIDRDENAYMEIAIYNSKFDTDTRTDPQLAEAFDFFRASTAAEKSSADFFVDQYYSYAQSNQSDESRALAQQQLEVISRHLGQDIASRIDSQRLENMGATAVVGDGRMSVQEAAKYLDIEPNYTAEIIQGYVNNLVSDTTVIHQFPHNANSSLLRRKT